jgi:alpha-tubulin suppressor-like RCC1 family protein
VPCSFLTPGRIGVRAKRLGGTWRHGGSRRRSGGATSTSPIGASGIRSGGSGPRSGSTFRAYCWGWNSVGQLGNGSHSSSDQRLAPVAVVGTLRFRGVSVAYHHSCGVTTTDRAYCWGGDGSPQVEAEPESGAQDEAKHASAALCAFRQKVAGPSTFWSVASRACLRR